MHPVENFIHVLSKQGKFVEDEAKYIFAQITAAVDHMVK